MSEEKFSNELTETEKKLFDKWKEISEKLDAEIKESPAVRVSGGKGPQTPKFEKPRQQAQTVGQFFISQQEN